MELPSILTSSKSCPLKIQILAYGTALLVCHHYIYAIPMAVQLGLFVVIMLLTGIPHGAIDHLVEEQNQSKNKLRFSLARFLSRYLSKMLLYGILWVFLPTVALLIFIGISAYHFGETDLASLPQEPKSEKNLFLSYGWLLVSVLLVTHLAEVVPILSSLPRLSDSSLDTAIIWLRQYQIQYLIACACWFLVSLIYYVLRAKARLGVLLNVGAQGVVLMVVCAKLPLLLAFSFYFGLWHSLVCLQSIRQHLMQNGQLLAWNKLVKEAAFFSVIAILGIGAIIVMGNKYNQTPDVLLGLFIGIAILTAPHMEVMSNMFDELRTNAPKQPDGGLAV